MAAIVAVVVACARASSVAEGSLPARVSRADGVHEVGHGAGADGCRAALETVGDAGRRLRLSRAERLPQLDHPVVKLSDE